MCEASRPLTHLAHDLQRLSVEVASDGEAREIRDR